MAPKVKVQKSEWCECTHCQRVISSRDILKHTKTLNCEHDAGDEVTYGYIKNGILHGLCSPWIEPADSDKWPSRFNDELLQMSPCTLRICSLCIGSLVVINDTTVMKAWPVVGMQPACLGLTENSRKRIGIKSGELAIVHSLPGPHVPAQSISVLPRVCKTFMMERKFNGFVLRHLNGQFVRSGDVIQLRYYGQECEFIVCDITGSDGSCSRVDLSQSLWGKDETSQCIQDLSNLTLDESSAEDRVNGTPSKDCATPQDLLTSTPVHSKLKSPSAGDSYNNSDLFRTPVTLALDEQSSYTGSRFYFIADSSKLTVVTNNEPKVTQGQGQVTYESVGGLDDQIREIKEMIDLPLNQPELFSSYGLTPPRGILLYGPSGTGKTLLMQAVCSQCTCHVILLSGSNIWSKFYGETEAKLRSAFQEAAERSPTLIVIDQLDTLCPKRDSSQNEVEKRVVASFLTFLDGLHSTNSRGHVMVLGCTSKPDSIDPALRRPGRFDREIETGVPTAKQRFEILTVLLRSVSHSLTTSEVHKIADSCHGYVGADLSALCKEAAMCSLRTLQKGTVPCLTLEDMETALHGVKPSAMREVAIDVPKVLWNDIGGQAELKLKLKQAVEWPLKHPEAFHRLGIRPPRGVLMYGPPGCSKTMIAKALATESQLNFISIKGPELFSKWVGESEKAVREVFRKARAAAPSIVFFDEIDALAVERGSSSGGSNVADRVLAQLLTEIDGVECLQDVTIVAATNRPDMIDKALQRPGRLDRIVYVPLPDAKTRREIFQIRFRTMPVAEDVSLDNLVLRTEKYSGAEVTAVCNEAALCALQEDMAVTHVMSRHFDQALHVVVPRISEDTIQFYEDYHHKCGLHQM